MLQDIYPHLFDNHFKVSEQITASDYILNYSNNQLLLKLKDGQYSLPTYNELEIIRQQPIYLFTFNGNNCFWVNETIDNLPEFYSHHDIAFLRTQVQKEIAWIGAVGNHLKEWYLQNQYCGRCGSPTQHKSDERALVCPQCHHLIFPKISPAIIVAVTCNDNILLAHNVNFPNNLYSLIAGYADVGETLEQTIKREIKEEVGIDVYDIRYYKSQPWPFSGSLMIGFTAKADDKQPIRPDNVEISDAQWFNRHQLPYRPNSGSIAGEMLEMFEKGEL